MKRSQQQSNYIAKALKVLDALTADITLLTKLFSQGEDADWAKLNALHEDQVHVDDVSVLITSGDIKYAQELIKGYYDRWDKIKRLAAVCRRHMQEAL